MPDKITCDGCGACCMEQCSPPGYVGVIANPATRDRDEDQSRVANLPAEARALLDKYMAGPMWDDAPCVWFDLDSRRCRFYEHRPAICREFEVGAQWCLEWRKEFAHRLEAVKQTKEPTDG